MEYVLAKNKNEKRELKNREVEFAVEKAKSIASQHGINEEVAVNYSSHLKRPVVISKDELDEIGEHVKSEQARIDHFLKKVKNNPNWKAQ